MTINPDQESQKIISWINTTFKNAGKKIAIIGLSGGVDSAVSFALTAKALGPETIHAYHLPSKTTNPQHLKDIQQLTSGLGLKTDHFHLIPIGSIIQKSWRIIHRHSETRSGIQSTKSPIPKQSQEMMRLRLANLAARIRMMILFDQAKKYNGLVIGTENKSESMLGYFTRFGDAASDLEPIAHLFKTQVFQLAQHLKIPQTIINKSPSADLWPGQSDQAELGFSYADADPILYSLDQGKTPQAIIKTGRPANLVHAIVDQVNRTAFKHHVPYTPSPKR